MRDNDAQRISWDVPPTGSRVTDRFEAESLYGSLWLIAPALLRAVWLLNAEQVCDEVGRRGCARSSENVNGRLIGGAL